MGTLNDILMNHLMTDVELSYLETLLISRKFNIVLLYKDQIKESLEGLDKNLLEDMKKLLSANNRQYVEGPPLNWSQIMKEVKENPQQFTEAGGWVGLDLGMSSNLVVKKVRLIVATYEGIDCLAQGREDAGRDQTETTTGREEVTTQLTSQVRADLEESEGDGDQDEPPSKKTRLEEISDKIIKKEINSNNGYYTESDLENSLTLLDELELPSLLEETSENKISEETKKFIIEDYTEKISRFCQASLDSQYNVKLSRHQLLRLGQRFSTKFSRSPALTFLLGAIDVNKAPNLMESSENKKTGINHTIKQRMEVRETRANQTKPSQTASHASLVKPAVVAARQPGQPQQQLVIKGQIVETSAGQVLVQDNKQILLGNGKLVLRANTQGSPQPRAQTGVKTPAQPAVQAPSVQTAKVGQAEKEKCPLCPLLWSSWASLKGHLIFSHLREVADLPRQQPRELVQCKGGIRSLKFLSFVSVAHIRFKLPRLPPIHIHHPMKLLTEN